MKKQAERSARRRLFLLVGSALALSLTAPAQTSLTGAGATFPAPIYTKWFAAYQSVGNAQINYQPNGSGGGIRAVTEGTVDFGASDMPLTDEQLKAFKAKHGSDVLLFPTVVGAVVPTYNIPGFSGELAFTPELLANIFLGKVKTWNDPAITKVNPGVHLPAKNIVVVHRSDGSGTTFCFTDYLSKVSADWKSRVGKNTSVEWPTGLGAKGNDGVAGLIKNQQGSIGYVELIYASKNHLMYGKVKNKTGNLVKADLGSVEAAAASVRSMPDDFRVSITDTDGPSAYPISTFTWLLIPSKFEDGAKKKAMVGFLQWALTKGQAMVEGSQYARLPAAVVAKEQKAIAKIQ